MGILIVKLKTNALNAILKKLRYNDLGYKTYKLKFSLIHFFTYF